MTCIANLCGALHADWLGTAHDHCPGYPLRNHAVSFRLPADVRDSIVLDEFRTARVCVCVCVLRWQIMTFIAAMKPIMTSQQHPAPSTELFSVLAGSVLMFGDTGLNLTDPAVVTQGMQAALSSMGDDPTPNPAPTPTLTLALTCLPVPAAAPYVWSIVHFREPSSA